MNKITPILLAALLSLTLYSGLSAGLVNLSARASVGSGEETFIIGFIVTGDDGEMTPVLALGSGAEGDNITNPIGDASISLFQHNEGSENLVIASNDNWMDGGQMRFLSSTGIAPATELSSGLVTWLEPGAYSFHIADMSGNGGIAIAELFEMVFKDIPNSIIDAADFNTLVTALVAASPSADLISLLSGEGPFTVFAPTDEAFAKIPADDLNAILADTNLLADILQYHVVAGSVPASAVTNTKLGMANGSEAIVQVTNAGGVIVQGANVVEADFYASNGIIHAIDSVILPPSGNENIVDVLSAAGNFSTLLSAAIATGAADTLVTDGPFTLFAPTDDAFAALPEGTLASLSDAQLLDILLYHVVVGLEVPASAVTASMVEMGNGQMVTLGVGEGVTVNDSNVILADLFGTNGVVHVIDKVLLPPSN